MTRALLFAAAAAALWVMAPGLADPYQTPRLLALGLVAVAMMLAPSSQGSDLEFTIVSALVLWCMAATFTTDWSYTLVGEYLQPFDGFTAVIVYATLALGVARLGLAAEDAADAICWMSLPLSAYAIFQRFHADPLLPAALPSGRVVAMQGSPVYLGPVLAIVAACAMARRRWLPLAAALPALYFTGTRGALAGAAVAAVILAPRRARLALIAAGAAALLLHPRAGAVASDVGRIEIWRTAWAIFRSSPIVGTGPGTFGIAFREMISPAYVIVRHSTLAAADHAHNELLQVLATTGIVGALAYLLVAGHLAILAAGDGLLLAAGAAYLVPAMLNPAPHAAVALLALLFGSAACRQLPVVQPRRWGLAAAAAMSVYICSRMAAADWYAARAMRMSDPIDHANALNRAAQLNPWEPRYTAAQLEAVQQLTHAPLIMAASVSIAEDLVMFHPRDSSAHEILGLALARAAANGSDTGRAALEQYDLAQKFAPTYAPLMARRRALAHALGLEAEAAQAGRELARAQALERGGA
jgi:O-antigen ligase